MTKEEFVLKEMIMTRVRFIHAWKSVTASLAVKFALFAALIVAASFFVSVPHILKNMPSLFEIKGFAQFFVAAFLNTKLATQAITLGGLVVFFYMLRDIARVFRSGASGLRIA